VKKQVSIRDVAKKAGVSATTVSYILNDNPHNSFSQETRDRVFSAVNELNYVPDQAAKTLGSSRVRGNIQSKLIGIVIPQMETTNLDPQLLFSNPFYSTLLSVVELEIRKTGYHLIVSGTNPGQSYMEIVKSRALDGVIIVGVYPEKDESEYRRYKVPVVLVDCYGIDENGFYSIRTDDRWGGYLATKYLIDRGHRNIALVTGEINEIGVNSMRHLGYEDAMKEAGIQVGRELVFEGYVNYKHGLEAAREIAAKHPEITAVFATSDITAIGIVNGLREAGISVPEDMSLVGFDDVDLAKMCYPPLTTVRQNIAQKGRIAVELILSSIDNHDSIKGEEKIIPLEIVERGTVRAIYGD
jgi:LacI family transcriptional regulator